jgi:hypothetical protein
MIVYGIFICLILILSLFSIEPRKEYRELISTIVLYGIPIIVLLSLFFTLGRNNSKWINLQFLIITPIVATCAYITIALLSIFFENHWVDFSILYENKNDKNQTINEQLLDVGALGYGGKRFVNVNPVLGLFQKVTEIDTNQINRDEWIYVDREGDIKMP